MLTSMFQHNITYTNNTNTTNDSNGSSNNTHQMVLEYDEGSSSRSMSKHRKSGVEGSTHSRRSASRSSKNCASNADTMKHQKKYTLSTSSRATTTNR